MDRVRRDAIRSLGRIISDEAVAPGTFDIPKLSLRELQDLAGRPKSFLELIRKGNSSIPARSRIITLKYCLDGEREDEDRWTARSDPFLLSGGGWVIGTAYHSSQHFFIWRVTNDEVLRPAGRLKLGSRNKIRAGVEIQAADDPKTFMAAVLIPAHKGHKKYVAFVFGLYAVTDPTRVEQVRHTYHRYILA